MIDFSSFGLAANIAVFCASAAAIAFAGMKLSVLTDELVDRTGIGEILAGALFVGVSTSLPGAITSVTTAWRGFPELAIGNALGGLTAQTLFIAVSDLFYRRAIASDPISEPGPTF